MRKTFLHGTFDLTIDEKNRLLVPADIRRAMDPERDGEAFFVTIGLNRRPWLYPERGYETMVGLLESELAPGEDALAFDQLVFSLASRVEWDKQGRILLVEKYRTKTGLSRDITMIGARDHLELWNRDEWLRREEELEPQRPQIIARQRQLMKGPTVLTTGGAVNAVPQAVATVAPAGSDIAG